MINNIDDLDFSFLFDDIIVFLEKYDLIDAFKIYVDVIDLKEKECNNNETFRI